MSRDEELQQQIHALKSELAYAKGKAEAMTEAIDRLHNEIREAHKRENTAYIQVDMLTDVNAKLQKDLELAEGTIAAREAELGTVRGELAEQDRSRIKGVEMLKERDLRIAELTNARDGLLAVASKWQTIATRRKKLAQEACDIADKHVFVPPANLGNTAVPVSWSGVLQLDSTAPYREKARIAEIRREVDSQQPGEPELYVSPPMMSNRHDRDKIEQDIQLFGTGFGRIRPDGRVEHIPAEEVLIYHAPSTATRAKDWGETVLELLKKAQGAKQPEPRVMLSPDGACPQCTARGSLAMTSDKSIWCVVCNFRKAAPTYADVTWSGGVDPGAGPSTSAEVTFKIENGEKKPVIRGVDFDCEGCGKREGSTLTNGWHRCNACGHPGK